MSFVFEKNISLKSALPQFLVQFNHLWNRQKNVREIAGEFVKATGEAGDLPHLGKELFRVSKAGFKSRKHGRTAENAAESGLFLCCARRFFLRRLNNQNPRALCRDRKRMALDFMAAKEHKECRVFW